MPELAKLTPNCATFDMLLLSKCDATYSIKFYRSPNDSLFSDKLNVQKIFYQIPLEKN